MSRFRKLIPFFSVVLVALISSFMAPEEGNFPDGPYIFGGFGTCSDSIPLVERNNSTQLRWVCVGSRVKSPVRKMVIVSTNNANSEYMCWIIYNSVNLDANLDLMVINDTAYGESSSNGEGGSYFLPRYAAEQLASDYSVQLLNRRHPGHHFEYRFATDRKVYARNQHVFVNFFVKNTGDSTVSFARGGEDLNATGRCDRFRFIGIRDGDTLPDCCNSPGFGGRYLMQTLAKGDSDSLREDMSNWIDFSKPGHYQVICIYNFELERMGPDLPYPENQELQWDENAHQVIEVTVK